MYPSRVIKYVEAGEERRVYDPTVDREWLRKKAEKLGVRLKVEKDKVRDQVVPEVFRGELGELKNPAGWGKSLESLPAFTNKEIQSFVEKANKNVYGENATKIKNFERGKQLVRENFVDLFRFVVKEEGDCVHAKALVGVSLRQKCHWVSVNLNKHSATIEFCHCICEAGKGRTCSHAYAVLHLLAKWSLDQLTEVPDPTPVTSSLCAWNVPQARRRADTPSFMNIRFR